MWTLCLNADDRPLALAADPLGEDFSPNHPDEDADLVVVLMGLHLPGMNGIECARAIRQALPDVQVIMLTVEEDPELAFQALGGVRPATSSRAPLR